MAEADLGRVRGAVKVVAESAVATVDRITDRRFLLVSPSGITALVSSLGAGLVSLTMPDRNGRFEDVVLGFDTPGEYLDNARMYLGCTVGRVAQRIRGAAFEMGGRVYRLAANDGRNSLHGGGSRSWDKVTWDAEVQADAGADTASILFRYVSPAGEEGYPGTVEASVRYTLTATDDLRLEYRATTDSRTPVNLTTHTYWNLAGAGKGSILGHEVQILAGSYTPTDDELIPSGTMAAVDGTAWDFRKPVLLGERIVEVDHAPTFGYDLNFVLDGERSTEAVAATLRHPASGRLVEVLTTQPCVQLYSGNFMTPTVGKSGRRYDRRTGLCLEPQGFPDAVNNRNFPSPFLEPGEQYQHSIVFRLRTDAARTENLA